MSDPRNLVFISDGTLSTLDAGRETNAGLLYRLLETVGQRGTQRFAYDPGVQGTGWRRWLHAASGEGVNQSIRRGYAFLAGQYRPGDRIFLIGFSRGAFAVRSLAGMIGTVGLLHARYASERYVDLAFRHYEAGVGSAAGHGFRQRRCHTDAAVEMLGVWDTVRALGLPYPVLSRLAAFATEFHDYRLGPHIRHGYQALALDEDRIAYRPVLWRQSAHWQGRLEQVWFPGAHGDVGGEVRALTAARGLSNIPLNWMLRRAARHGMVLPDGWESAMREDPTAPATGSRRGIAKLFVLRQPRRVGYGDGETIHLSVRDRMRDLPGYQPKGIMSTDVTSGNRADPK